MLCNRSFVAAAALLSAAIIAVPTSAPAQTSSAATPAPKAKLTRQKLSEMRAK
jgi:hypothetical protein